MLATKARGRDEADVASKPNKRLRASKGSKAAASGGTNTTTVRFREDTEPPEPTGLQTLLNATSRLAEEGKAEAAASSGTSAGPQNGQQQPPRGGGSGGSGGVDGPLRDLMKRPSFGDILQTLQPNDFQNMSPEMSAIVAAAQQRRQQDVMAAAQVVNSMQPGVQVFTSLNRMPGQPQQFFATPVPIPGLGVPVTYATPQPAMMAAAAAAEVPIPDAAAAALHQQQLVQAAISGGQHALSHLARPSAAEPTKKERRLAKNREAAKECRRKKKQYLMCLEDRVKLLEEQNEKLMGELQKAKTTLAVSNGQPPPSVEDLKPAVDGLEENKKQLEEHAAKN